MIPPIEKILGNKSIKEKTSCDKITISCAEAGKESIVYRTRKETIVNGEVIGTSPSKSVTRSVPSVIMEQINFTDPVTGEQYTMHIAGVVEAIRQTYRKFYLEDEAEEAERAAERSAEE